MSQVSKSTNLLTDEKIENELTIFFESKSLGCIKSEISDNRIQFYIYEEDDNDKKWYFIAKQINKKGIMLEIFDKEGQKTTLKSPYQYPGPIIGEIRFQKTLRWILKQAISHIKK